MSLQNDRVNALTVDIEDYFQVESLADVVSRAEWLAWPRRVVANTHVLLELFAEQRVRATFFVLGWIAEHEPHLVREIVGAGHELACHGYEHRLIYKQTRDEFRKDVRSARARLEDVAGVRVDAYRAPSYSITRNSTWAVDVLIDEGFRYDSSMFPVHHDRYGMPKAERFPYLLSTSAGELIEFPPSTVRLPALRCNVPVAGGGYFRIYPYRVFKAAFQHINRADGEPAMFVVHPWEIDPGQPSVASGWFNHWRHHVNLARTLPRLRQLLTDFKFAPARDVLAGYTRLR
jgi:polysaccharide deacetylase family protein (PEP-CTERM system associated)